MTWNRIHSVMDGWGLEEEIPGNEEVVEDHPDALIPWRVVRSRQTPRHLW